MYLYLNGFEKKMSPFWFYQSKNILFLYSTSLQYLSLYKIKVQLPVT